MGNIVLSRTVIFIYVVLCLVFLVSPFISGRGKRFGVKVKNGREIYVICLLYGFTAVCIAFVFTMLCVHKKSAVFMNISFILYIMFMSLIYFYIRDNFKKKFNKDIFREIVVNIPSGHYVVKGINVFLYILYFIPVALSGFCGKNDLNVLYICVLQTVIAFASFGLGILICKTRYYVDDDVEQSLKKIIKYRKLWNCIVFCTLLVLSIAISLMYINYLGFGG